MAGPWRRVCMPITRVIPLIQSRTQRFRRLSIASIAILTDHWAFSLYGKNLGNEEGITGSYPAAYMSTDTGIFENYYGNNQRNYISTPRTFGISATYRYR